MNSNERNELFGKPSRSRAALGSLPPSQASPEKASKQADSSNSSRLANNQTSIALEQRRSAQLKEAEIAQKTAERYVTKNWKNWTCDYFSAAPFFEKAAASYKTCGNNALSIKMYEQAGECQDQNSSCALAARNYKEAAQIAYKIDSMEEASRLYHCAAMSWINGGEVGKAGEYFGKSAEVLEDIDEDRAVTKYRLAVDTIIPEGSDALNTDFIKIVGSKDTIDRCILFLLQIKRFSDALYVIRRYYIFLNAERAYHTLYRLFLTETIILLYTNDCVAAGNVFMEVHLQSDGYLNASECKVEEDLLTAFKNYNVDLLESLKKDRTLLRLDAPTVRIARQLTIEGAEMIENITYNSKNTQPTGLSDVSKRISALSEKHDVTPAKPTQEKIEENEDIVDLGLDDLVLNENVEGNSIYDSEDIDEILERAKAECYVGTKKSHDDEEIDLT